MAPLGTCVDLAVTVPTLFAHTIRARLPKFISNFCQTPLSLDHDLCKRKSGLQTHLAITGLARRQQMSRRFSFAAA